MIISEYVPLYISSLKDSSAMCSKSIQRYLANIYRMVYFCSWSLLSVRPMLQVRSKKTYLPFWPPNSGDTWDRTYTFSQWLRGWTAERWWAQHTFFLQCIFSILPYIYLAIPKVVFFSWEVHERLEGVDWYSCVAGWFEDEVLIVASFKYHSHVVVVWVC